MQPHVLALMIQEGTRLISQIVKYRVAYKPIVLEPSKMPLSLETPREESPIVSLALKPETSQNTSSEVATGCVPCAIGHFGTCSGLLNEAMRFAREDGIGSSEVIDRVNICLDELNTMERVDLRSEKIQKLPPWEKEIAERALQGSRAARHGLEGIRSTENLEKVTAATQTARQTIGRSWFKEKLKNMTPDEKERVHQQVMTRLEEIEEVE